MIVSNYSDSIFERIQISNQHSQVRPKYNLFIITFDMYTLYNKFYGILVQSPRATLIKYHTLGGLKEQKSIISQLWRQSLKSRCQQGHVFSETCGESSLALLQPLVVARHRSIPWLIHASLQFSTFTSRSPCASTSSCFCCVCLCVQISFFYKDISHIGLGPRLTVIG